MKDYRETLNIVGWILTSFSTTVIVLRLYTRTRVTELGWDDWLMLLGWIFAVVCTSTVTVGTTYGFGQHMTDIEDLEDKAVAAMYVLVAPLFSLGSAFFTKTSIIIAFMRIMGRTVTWVHKLIAYIPIFLLLVVTIMCASIMIFFCWPVQKSWRPYLPGTCADPKLLDIFGRTGSVYNACMDIFCAAVPIALIQNLNIDRKEKRNLMFLMGGSAFGAVATVMKIISMSTISNVADITHAWSEITIWYLTENHVLIMAGSAPALRPLWRIIHGKYSSYRTNSSSKNNTSNRISGSNGVHLPTIGSIRYNNRGKPTGPYSVDLRGDSDGSEESLAIGIHGADPPGLGGKGGKNKGGDTESVEHILQSPKYGRNESSVEGANKSGIYDRERRSDNGEKIIVTTEVKVM